MWSKNNMRGFLQHCLGVDFIRTWCRCTMSFDILHKQKKKKNVQAKSNLSPMYFPIMQSCHKCQYTFTFFCISKDLILKLKYVWNNLLRITALPIYLRMFPVYVDNSGHLLKHVTSSKVWGWNVQLNVKNQGFWSVPNTSNTQLHEVSSSIQVCDYSLCLYNLYKLSLKFLKMGKPSPYMF